MKINVQTEKGDLIIRVAKNDIKDFLSMVYGDSDTKETVDDMIRLADHICSLNANDLWNEKSKYERRKEYFKLCEFNEKYHDILIDDYRRTVDKAIYILNMLLF